MNPNGYAYQYGTPPKSTRDVQGKSGLGSV